MWDQFMAELREEHLGTRPRQLRKESTSIRAILQAAYEQRRPNWRNWNGKGKTSATRSRKS